jgi:hypothetical protein
MKSSHRSISGCPYVSMDFSLFVMTGYGDTSENQIGLSAVLTYFLVSPQVKKL